MSIEEIKLIYVNMKILSRMNLMIIIIKSITTRESCNFLFNKKLEESFGNYDYTEK